MTPDHIRQGFATVLPTPKQLRTSASARGGISNPSSVRTWKIQGSKIVVTTSQSQWAPCRRIRATSRFFPCRVRSQHCTRPSVPLHPETTVRRIKQARHSAGSGSITLDRALGTGTCCAATAMTDPFLEIRAWPMPPPHTIGHQPNVNKPPTSPCCGQLLPYRGAVHSTRIPQPNHRLNPRTTPELRFRRRSWLSAT